MEGEPPVGRGGRRYRRYRTRQKVTQRRDSKHDGTQWKGGTVDVKVHTGKVIVLHRFLH